MIVSRGLVLVYQVLRTSRWLSVREVARDCPGVSASSVPRLVRCLAREGVLERVELHEGYRYRLADPMPESALPFVARLEEVAAVLSADAVS
ncbi:hypothetical protein ACFXDJ_06945 [Streptomyces sp. NPDC059443]|uniref:hypothetical protein n=1 Tax=unclassified Streptomyces TaxID=2593676 RepID=UPI0036BEDA58